MDRLSNEVVELIIQHVDRPDLKEVALINRQFHTLANPILWRQLEIRDEQTFDRVQRTLTLHADYGQYIQKVSFGPMGLTDASLWLFIRRTPNLNTLELECALHLTEASLAQLVHDCPHLGSIRLITCPMRSMEILGQCPGLHKVEFWGACELNDGLFVSLPTSLTSLTMEWYHFRQGFINKTMAVLAELHQMTTLAFMKNIYDVSDCLTMTWPQLCRLQLQPCPGLTDEIAIDFIRRHPQLVRLVLYNTIFTDATLDAIATHLPGISHLGILVNPNITAHGVRRLVQRCKDLVRFELNHSNILADDLPGYGGNHPYDMYVTCLDRHDMTAIRLTPIN